MNWNALLDWVNDPTRNIQELRNACSGLGLAPTGNTNQLLTKLRAHIASQPDRNATAPWTPAPANQPFAPPVPGTPAPTPAPTNGSGNANLWPLVAIVALIVGGLIAWIVLKDNNDGSSNDGPVDTVQVVDVTAPPAADPTDTPTEPEGFTPFEIPTQGNAYVPANTCVEGDIQVLKDGQWIALYDDVATSGLVTCFTWVTNVRAPWGAYVSDSDANRQQEDLLVSGCGLANGCDSVVIKFWPES